MVDDTSILSDAEFEAQTSPPDDVPASDSAWLRLWAEDSGTTGIRYMAPFAAGT